MSICYLFAVICAVGLARPATADASQPILTGTVTRIVDGDTLDVRLDSGPIRVRLYAIDAPEKKQPHGKESTTVLSSLLSGKEVQLEPIQQDRYDRLVAIVYVAELNVNAELVRRGHAWAYRRYMRKKDAKLCAYEADARRGNRGLWAGPDDQLKAPWEWRNKKLKWATDFSQETVDTCVAAIGKR